jgi:hypothetical protein
MGVRRKTVLGRGKGKCRSPGEDKLEVVEGQEESVNHT